MESLGYSVERVSTGLRELISRGLIARRRLYWRETGRFRNFYFLTNDGLIEAQKLVDSLKNERVGVLTLSGLPREMSLEELRAYLGKLAKLRERNVYELKQSRHVDLTYTNILNHLKGRTFETRSFIAPRGIELNERIWEMIRDAHFDGTHKYVVLTRNKNWQAGVIWLKRGIKKPFVAEFRFKAGGGSGGDGLVFMFYKRKDYWPADGGNLGFVPGVGTMPGYGIEFDSQPNPDYNDPPFPHIALIKDTPRNHLAYVQNEHVADFNWHEVRVAIGKSSVKVEVDGEKILLWEGEISRAHSGVGFAASTGGRTNWHIIDEVKISIRNS